MRKTKKASTKLKLLSRFLWLIAFSITLFFIYELNKINILPLKYSLILVGIMILLIFLFLFIQFISLLILFFSKEFKVQN